MKTARSAARVAAPALLAILLATAGGCRGFDNDIRRLWNLEGIRGSEQGQSIDELKEVIARYAKEADRVVEADAKVGYYHELLAARYLERAMFVEAYESLLESIRLFPAKTGLYYQAALAAGYVARTKEALGPAGEAERGRWLAVSEANYLRVLRDDPGHADALYGLAVLYEFELGKGPEVESLVRRFLEVRTRDVDGWMLLGRNLYGQGRLEESLSAYEEALQSARPANSIGGTPEYKRKAAAENRDRIREELDAAIRP